jgi:hypothetical protein
MTDAILGIENVAPRLRALACLNDLWLFKRLDRRYFPPDSRGGRFAIVLRALDGWRQGATHRDIAVALFGENRVETDWRHPGSHLRDRVRRAIHRGRWLMESGYQKLLR